jgi:hypothetical protein
MKTKGFATVFAVAAFTIAAPAFARDDGPRFAQDRLDALVAQHAEASRFIAHADRGTPREASASSARKAKENAS